MIWPDSLRLLTVGSAMTSAAFGLLGVATESRRDGKLTPFAWIAMLGIVLSTGFSVSIDNMKAERDEKDAEDRHAAEILSSSNR